ncbi:MULTISPECIES: hypothetical protein [Fusobacterium]|uniref:hypothetical protein n=1 Tax=Fusobacterium TaxID=848 RepID=UPI0026F12B0E|nr:hypothetical protein [Fusobacterium perfoetens]
MYRILLNYLMLIFIIIIISLSLKKFLKLKKEQIIYIFILLLTPFLFLGILKISYKYLYGTLIGEVSDWINFGGVYLGALLAIGGIAYQIRYDSYENRRKDIKEEINIYRFFIFYLEDLEVSFNNLKKNLKLVLLGDISSFPLEKLWVKGNILIDISLEDFYLEEIKKIKGNEIGIKLLKIYKKTNDLENVFIEFSKYKYFFEDNSNEIKSLKKKLVALGKKNINNISKEIEKINDNKKMAILLQLYDFYIPKDKIEKNIKNFILNFEVYEELLKETQIKLKQKISELEKIK